MKSFPHCHGTYAAHILKQQIHCGCSRKSSKNLHMHETEGCCCCHTGNQKTKKIVLNNNEKKPPLVLSKTEAVLSAEGWRHTALLQPSLAAHSVAVLCFYLSSILQQLRFHQCPSFFSSFHFTYFSKYLPEYLQNKTNKIKSY